MQALLFLFVVTLVNVSCDVIHDDDGGDGDCQESPWLCRQLAEMRRVMAEQQRVIQQQSSMIVDQSSMIVQQSSVIGLLQTEVSEQGSLMQKLQEELVTLKTGKENREEGVDSITQTSTETSVTSNQRDVASRSDDGNPLEAVVNQMSQQLTTMSAHIQVLQNSDTQQNLIIQDLKNANSQQDIKIQDASTSTFVHWGSSHCPSDAQLVYSGWVGGSARSDSGGGSNYLCLTTSPVMSYHAVPGYTAHLWGSEYQTYDAHNEMDPVCAVCRSSHSTTIMIPGTTVCTSGWTKQYDGFLMAENYNHEGASEFVCVDSVMESRPGSSSDEGGRLFFFTITRCGSLPCGPYENHRIVTCVVCSQ